MKMRALWVLFPLFLLSGCSAGWHLQKSKVYLVFSSDCEAPVWDEGMMQSEYQAIYIMDAAEKPKDIDELRRVAKRASELGARRAPRWTKQGDRIAYLDFSEDGKGKIAILDFSTGKTMELGGTDPDCFSGLSWDEAGRILAFRKRNGWIVTYNLETSTEVAHVNADAWGFSLSPSGEWICFPAKEATNANGEGRQSLNLLNTRTNKRSVVAVMPDHCGFTGLFYWSDDSKYIVFKAFQMLDGDRRRYPWWCKYEIGSARGDNYNGDFADVCIQNVRFWKWTGEPPDDAAH